MSNVLIDEFIKLVYQKISDKRYYYSQGRENKFAVDCSWLLISTLNELGIKTAATYTGDMVEKFRSSGRFDILKFSTDTMKRGDILLKHISGSNGHAVLYVGNNTIYEACNAKYGLRITNYYPNSYQYILRLKDTNKVDLPTLRAGSVGILVSLLQLFLNKYCAARLKTDGEYGPKTTEAIKNFQLQHANDDNNPTTDIDGITGVQTWTKIYSILLQD